MSLTSYRAAPPRVPEGLAFNLNSGMAASDFFTFSLRVGVSP